MHIKSLFCLVALAVFFLGCSAKDARPIAEEHKPAAAEAASAPAANELHEYNKLQLGVALEAAKAKGDAVAPVKYLATGPDGKPLSVSMTTFVGSSASKKVDHDAEYALEKLRIEKADIIMKMNGTRAAACERDKAVKELETLKSRLVEEKALCQEKERLALKESLEKAQQRITELEKNAKERCNSDAQKAKDDIAKTIAKLKQEKLALQKSLALAQKKAQEALSRGQHVDLNKYQANQAWIAQRLSAIEHYLRSMEKPATVERIEAVPVPAPVICRP